MKPTLMLSPFVLAAVLAAACDSPSPAQRAADDARVQAQEAAKEAQRAADEARLAVTATNRTQRDTTVSLDDAKLACRGRLATTLADIDAKIGELRASNESANATDTSKNDEQISTLLGRRTAITSDLTQVDLATAESWDAIRMQVDKDSSDARVAVGPMGMR